MNDSRSPDKQMSEDAGLLVAESRAESESMDPVPPEGEAAGLLELVLEAHQQREAEEEALCERIEGIVVGRLLGFDDDKQPRVSFAGCPEHEGRVATSAPRLTPRDIDREFALMFQEGDPERPMIIGPMVSPLKREQGVFRPDGEVLCDGEKVEVNAERELVLRCGKASITLTRAGKILLRGAYVSTRATGVNRVQGGSVQIN